jgi:hypothetical protein
VALDRDQILVENLRASLDLYQRSLVWAMTATAAFCVFTFNLFAPNPPTVSVAYGQVSAPAAWAVALALYFVLGILAASALRHAQIVVSSARLDPEVLEAALLYPSLATSANDFIRIGTVVLCPIAIWIAFGLELYRESATSVAERDGWYWLSLMLFGLLAGGPYGLIAIRLRHPLGYRTRRPLQATSASVVR